MTPALAQALLGRATAVVGGLIVTQLRPKCAGALATGSEDH
jgi:hypothetical protein